jgi:hypothetical protein
MNLTSPKECPKVSPRTIWRVSQQANLVKPIRGHDRSDFFKILGRESLLDELADLTRSRHRT